ncbi:MULTISPECIES: DUF4229 domain-containing protein [unclassified Isoptericola]|uniref:DUF4229 domain-containing protein n=1 Tax=unclassified Isoptericola TaxID=2623355 RepID=UPI003664FAE4
MPLVMYTVWRILLFVAALGAGYVLGLRSWLLVLVAAVVAFAVSYLALAKPREAAAVWLAEKEQRRKDGSAKHDVDTDFEDAVMDRESAVDGDAADPTGRTDGAENGAGGSERGSERQA